MCGGTHRRSLVDFKGRHRQKGATALQRVTLCWLSTRKCEINADKSTRENAVAMATGKMEAVEL